MALLNIEHGFSGYMERFERRYHKTAKEFIEQYSDKIVIDLSDKIVVALESHIDSEEENTPANLLGILIPEGVRHGYTAKLVYSGHIAFIILTYEDGKEKYLYKDDECCPQTWEEFKEECCTIFYDWVDEKGKNTDDLLTQIEATIKGLHDIDFKLNPESLILLEGL